VNLGKADFAAERSTRLSILAVLAGSANVAGKWDADARWGWAGAVAPGEVRNSIAVSSNLQDQ